MRNRDDTEGTLPTQARSGPGARRRRPPTPHIGSEAPPRPRSLFGRHAGWKLEKAADVTRHVAEVISALQAVENDIAMPEP
jgi:hypothetical protein